MLFTYGAYIIYSSGNNSSDHNMVLLKFNAKKSVEIDAKQFGGISRTSTRDVLVEPVHMWYKATDKFNSYIRVVMLDFSKAFNLIFIWFQWAAILDYRNLDLRQPCCPR